MVGDMGKWAESEKQSYLLLNVYYVRGITKSCSKNVVL